MAFVWNGEKQDQFDIYVKTLGIERPRRLTSDADSECHLAWSPDGASIAFVHCGSSEVGAPPGRVGLYLIPSTGGPKRRLAYIHEGGSPFGRTFTWAPDSKAVISPKALGGTADVGLFLFSTAGAAERQLTWPPPGSWDGDSAVSPDRRTLAFVRWLAHGVADIYLVSLDETSATRGQPTRLTFENDFVTNLLWTNDGGEFLYVKGNEGTRGVWRVRARAGAVPMKVPELAQAGVHLALSRQGKLAYSHRYWDFDIWRAELGGAAGSGKPAALISSTFSDAEPQYSPDGKSIAFQSNRSGAMEIWCTDSQGAAATQVTSLREEAGSPAWSPDGTEIAFDCRRV